MTRRMRYGTLLGTVGALFALIAPGSARAQQVEVTPTVTFGGGLYHYDYSIFNNTASDLLDIAINVQPGANTIQNLSVPDGFQGSVDTGLGIVDFLADVDSMGNPVVFGAGSSLNGFMFDSPFKPGGSSFTALTADGTALFGPTTAPVPEASGMALWSAALTLGVVVSRRRSLIRRGGG